MTEYLMRLVFLLKVKEIMCYFLAGMYHDTKRPEKDPFSYTGQRHKGIHLCKTIQTNVYEKVDPLTRTFVDNSHTWYIGGSEFPGFRESY